MTDAELVAAVPDVGLVAFDDGARLHHKFARFHIKGITQKRISIPTASLGLNRVVSLTPQPIGEAITVAWDGDTISPTLILSKIPATGAMEIQIECWGT